jgi:hypothetical protein
MTLILKNASANLSAKKRAEMYARVFMKRCKGVSVANS